MKSNSQQGSQYPSNPVSPSCAHSSYLFPIATCYGAQGHLSQAATSSTGSLWSWWAEDQQVCPAPAPWHSAEVCLGCSPAVSTVSLSPCWSPFIGSHMKVVLYQEKNRCAWLQHWRLLLKCQVCTCAMRGQLPYAWAPGCPTACEQNSGTANLGGGGEKHIVVPWKL